MAVEKYGDLRNAVTTNDGVYTTSMDTLKKIEGAGRLGVHVRNAISRSLESYGLGHLPRELPPNQEDPVRLYLLGSPVADVIKAVLTPSDKGDDTLRSISTSEAQEQLHQIRQIVCG
jgi:hypothetical protein